MRKTINVLYNFTSIKSRLFIKLFFTSLSYRRFQETVRNVDVHWTHLTKKKEEKDRPVTTQGSMGLKNSLNICILKY